MDTDAEWRARYGIDEAEEERASMDAVMVEANAECGRDSPSDAVESHRSVERQLEEDEEIPWCRRTRVADYSGRNLEELPVVIYDCSALTTLDVSNNMLTSLPMELGQLRMLAELYASHNNFWERQEAVDVSSLLRLRVLDLSFNGMERFPTGLFRLRKIETLDVSRNLLSIVPVDLKYLCNMTQLRMESNSIAVLPDSIANLESLEVLQAFDNHITHFEDQMAFPPKLRTLDLHSNRIEAIRPSQFTRCSGLRNLNVSNNAIGHVDEQMFRWLLHSLLELHLANNRFPTLPRSIGFLESLTVLDISRNRSLTSLPKSIGRLKSLARLDARDCSLEALPRSIGRLKSLQQLLVGGNQLVELPPTVGLLSTLTVLDVSRNNLRKLPPTLILILANKLLEFIVTGNVNIASPPEDICQKGREAVLEFLAKVPQTLQEMEEGWEVLDPTPEEDKMLFDVSDEDLSWSGELQSSRMYSQFLMAASAHPPALQEQQSAIAPAAVGSQNGEGLQEEGAGWLSYLTSWLW